MGAGTFPDRALQQYIEKNYVPVKYVSGLDSEQFYRYGILAEPAFIVLDPEGNEIYRKIGYFEADLLIEQLEKAKKKAARRAALNH